MSIAVVLAENNVEDSCGFSVRIVMAIDRDADVRRVVACGLASTR